MSGCITAVSVYLHVLQLHYDDLQDELRSIGIRKVIGWFHFGNMPYPTIRRSMQFMATDVIPTLCQAGSQEAPVKEITRQSNV